MIPLENDVEFNIPGIIEGE